MPIQALAFSINVKSQFLSSPSGLSEALLFFLSIVSHLLDVHKHLLSRVIVFPNLLLNIYVYSFRQLYGKVLYSIISIVLNVYAFFKWKKNSVYALVPVSEGGVSTVFLERKDVFYSSSQVSTTPCKTFLLAMVLGLVGTIGWSYLVPEAVHIPLYVRYLDAAYASFGLVEKWFMSHKKLERWIIAFVRYIIFSIVCYKVGTMVLAIQFIVLAFVAIYGQFQWYKDYKHS